MTREAGCRLLLVRHCESPHTRSSLKTRCNDNGLFLLPGFPVRACPVLDSGSSMIIPKSGSVILEEPCFPKSKFCKNKPNVLQESSFLRSNMAAPSFSYFSPTEGRRRWETGFSAIAHHRFYTMAGVFYGCNRDRQLRS